MAKVLLHDPVATVSGRTGKAEKVIFRTRCGRTHAYVVEKPNTNPPSEKQKANSAAFGSIARQAYAEMADAERRAYWEASYNDYKKRHALAYRRALNAVAPAPYSSRNKPVITTLYGYIFHTLYAQRQEAGTL